MIFTEGVTGSFGYDSSRLSANVVLDTELRGYGRLHRIIGLGQTLPSRQAARQALFQVGLKMFAKPGAGFRLCGNTRSFGNDHNEPATDIVRSAVFRLLLKRQFRRCATTSWFNATVRMRLFDTSSNILSQYLGRTERVAFEQ